MIRKNTVFILGAGASKDFGYPTGKELIDKICNDDSEETAHVRELEQLGHSGKKLKMFKRELSLSCQSSVDAFLEKRKEYMDIGKIAIAQALIPCERADSLLIDRNKWYAYLLSLMLTSVDFDSFSQNKVGFITFNYDRSLEHVLFNALKNSSSGKSDIEHAAKLSQIQIIHMHGQLDYLPWQKVDGRAYGADCNNIKQLQSAADSIRIMNEEADETSQVLESITSLLKLAENIIFLGFGYHSSNLDRLGRMNLSLIDKKIMGTAIGLGAAEQINIKNKFCIEIALLSSKDIVSFFKEHAVSFLEVN